MKNNKVKTIVMGLAASVMAVSLCFTAPVSSAFQTQISANASGWNDQITTEGNNKVYWNERFGYWVHFPKFMKRYGTPVTNGDGAQFKGRGVNMTISGRYDIFEEIDSSAESTYYKVKTKNKNGKRTYDITAYVIGSEGTGIVEITMSAKKSKLSTLKKVKNTVCKNLKNLDQFN